MSGIINGKQELKGSINAKQSLIGDMAVKQGVDGKDYILTDADKNEIAELISGTKANAIINSASGETILTTDSANAQMESMKVFGKSWQNTVGGNQLFDASITTNKNVTVENGVITFNIDTTDDYLSGSYGGTTPLINLRAGTYVVSSSDANIKVTMYCMVDGSYVNIDSVSPPIAILNADTFVQGIRVRSVDGTSLKGKPFTIMLNKGTSKLPFEPYVGGIPSPNPNYPQDIHSNGNSGSIEYALYGKNLSPTDKATTLSNGYLNATTGTYGYTKKGLTYSLSAYCPTNSKGNLTLRAFDGTNMLGNHVSKNLVPNTRISFEFTSQYDGYLVFAFNDSNYVSTDVLTDVQLELGSATEYEPYKEPQPLILQTPNGLNGLKVTLESEANYKDADGNLWACDYVDFKRGKFVQRIVEAVLDGSKFAGFLNENVWHFTDTSLFGTNVLHAETKEKPLYYVASDRFLFQSQDYQCTVSRFPKMMFFHGSGNSLSLRATDLFETQNDAGFYKFFSEYPTRIYAIRKEPFETDLTEEEIAQYKALMMNYPNTTIINDANAYTEVEYVADTKCYIDNKFKELETKLVNVTAELL
jgi:hypothetical protein